MDDFVNNTDEQDIDIDYPAQELKNDKICNNDFNKFDIFPKLVIYLYEKQKTTFKICKDLKMTLNFLLNNNANSFINDVSIYWMRRTTPISNFYIVYAYSHTYSQKWIHNYKFFKCMKLIFMLKSLEEIYKKQTKIVYGLHTIIHYTQQPDIRIDSIHSNEYGFLNEFDCIVPHIMDTLTFDLDWIHTPPVLKSDIYTFLTKILSFMNDSDLFTITRDKSICKFDKLVKITQL